MNELSQTEAGGVPDQRQSDMPLVEFLNQALSNKDIDAAKVAVLIEAYERREADWRQRQWDRAFFALQGDLRKIKKNHPNPETKSAYADQWIIDDELHPLCQRHDFLITYDPVDGPEKDRVYMRALLIHKDGHRQQYGPISIPYDTTGPKGARNKTDTHGAGSAYSYAQRYITGRMFWLRFGEEDDGNAAGGNTDRRRVTYDPPPKTPLQPTTNDPESFLGKVERSLIKAEVEGDGFTFLKLLKIAGEKVGDLATLDALKSLPVYLAMYRAAPQPQRVEFDTVIGLANARLRKVRVTDQPGEGGFFTLVNAWGEVIGEYTTPRGFAEALINEWRKLEKAQQDELLYHNADTIHQVYTVLVPADPMITEWAKTPAEKPKTRTPITYATVKPPKDRGRWVWSAWVKLLRDDLNSLPDPSEVHDWIEAQRGVIASAPTATRAAAIATVTQYYGESEENPPEWLAQLLDNDEAWSEATIYQLTQLPVSEAGRVQLRAITAADDVRRKMAELQKAKKPLFDRVRAAMVDADKRLPKLPKGQAA